MINNRKNFSLKILVILFVVTLIVFAAHLLLKYISIVIYNEHHGFFYELSARFDVNDENSVPQWFSHLLFLSIGLSAGLAGYLNRKRMARMFWSVVAVVGVLLSLDDVAALHEFILQSLHNTFFLNVEPSFFVNAWLIVMPLLLLLGGLLAWWGWKVLPSRTLILFVVGGGVFIFGKIVMDSSANVVNDLFLDRGIIQGFEKLFQYTGMSIVLYGILDYLERNYSSSLKEALKQLK